ncbi:MAG TPA: DUF3383 family protein [Bryobacteraceae bacterium]|jgi:hypothetical protein|nr:DUF3383 family protein [Bryobacteraceae bacterium]
MPTTQPLSVVVNVAVTVAPVAAATPTFNQGLIVGPSTVIPASQRVRQYTSLAAMLSDGFTATSPEYLAAQLYFGQTPTPQYLWVGRQDLTVPETPLQALQACRAASPNWWACLVTDAVAADHEAIAAWIQAATPQSCYFYTTSDANVLSGATGNVASVLQAGGYSRVFGVYSTTQGGAAPNNAYAAAAAMGVAMGSNTGLANSYFTLKFKPLTGVVAEPLTNSQITALEALNINLYLSYANTYTWLEQGQVANGQYLDEILNLDMLSSDIQYSLVNLLISQPSIPQTNAGESQLIAAVHQACDNAVSRGFIAPGVWEGQTILNLSAGTALPKGYLVQSDTFANQSAGDRAARKAMPIYVALIEAGAMHSITVGVYVQR